MNKEAKIFTYDKANIFVPTNDKTIMLKFINKTQNSIQYKDGFFKIIEVNLTDEIFNDVIKILLECLDLETEGKLNKFDLVVCSGVDINFSCAFFVALNDIYDLGYISIKEQYITYDKKIYKQILQIKDKAVLLSNTDYFTWCEYHSYEDYAISGLSEKVLIQL